MRGSRSQRFGSARRAVAPVVGTLILIVVVVTAVGSFAYMLSALQSQNENSQSKVLASQNDNLLISLVQLSPTDPETQFQFNYNGGILYVHYVTDTSVEVYDFGTRAFPGTLVTLDHSFARIEGGLQAYVDLKDPQAQLTFSTSPPANPNFVLITFQAATWNSMTLTLLNENTQGSGVSAISVNDLGISSFEEVDQSSGSLIATFFPAQGVPLNLPGRAIATLEVNVQKLNLLKNSTLSVNVLSTHDNLFSTVLSPPSSFFSASMLNQFLGPSADSQTMTMLDGSRSLSTNNSIVKYMWRIDVPFLSSWNGNWNDYDNILTVYTQGRSLQYTPGAFFTSNVLPFLNNSELRATLTVVDSRGLMSSSTQVLNPQTQESVSTQGNSHYPLPRSPPPAKHLYVTMDQSWGYTLTALEGLVARQTPQIFFQQNQLDGTYLNEIKAEFGISSEVDTTLQILQRFVTPQYVSQTNGMFNVVVFDSNEPASDYYWETNTARTIAGVTGALPVGSAQLGQFQSWFPTNVLYDLTSPTICTGCAETSAGAVAGYTWAWTTFGPQTSRQFQTMSPNGRFMGGDYEVEFKSFVWSMCNPSVASGCTYDATQSNLANTILAAYPAGSVSMGFFGLNGESNTIDALSTLGILQDNSELSTDLSLYSGLPSLTSINLPPVGHLTFDPNKNYVLWEYSQGDADTYEFYAIQNIYQQVDPVTGNYFRDEIPVTIQLKTMMAQTAPPVLQLYYADQNSLADFMTSPSGGAGYGHPEIMPAGTGTGSENWFLQLSSSLAQNVGVGDVFVIWGGGHPSQANIESYIQGWGSPQPYGLFFWQNSGAPALMCSSSTCTNGALSGGVPVFTTTFWVPNWGLNGWNSQSVADTVQCIQGFGVPADPSWGANGGQGPCDAASVSSHFINPLMNTQLPGYDFIQAVMQQLGPNYIAVNSQQYVCLYLQSQSLAC